MNDLELLRQFRSEAEPPDRKVVESAYRRMLAEPDTARAERRSPRRPRHLAAPAHIALAACVAAATAAAVLVLVPSRHPGGIQSAAAAVLQRAADTAASQAPVGPPGPGQYVYTKTRSLSEVDTYDVGPNHDLYFAVSVPVVREAWIAPDGSGRILETDGTPTFLTSRDRSAWIAAGRPALPAATTSDQSFAPSNGNGPGCEKTRTGGACGGLFYLDLGKLPTDVAALRTMIEDRKIEGGPPGDGETFTIIGDMLRETYAPPQVRSALYQIASELPEVRLIGNVKDPTGRPGVAVAYPANGVLHELIFDPSTSALLGERTVIADPDRAGLEVPAGTVVDWSAYLASGIVDSTSERP
jgi:hypothetical protein